MRPDILGSLVHSFFIDFLKTQKGLRPASIQSYRDGIRLFLNFAAQETGRRISRLGLEDLTEDRVLQFLCYLEEQRGNHIRTRNHRLAILRTFFEYVASRMPERLDVAQQVTRIPTKRASPPETQYLTRQEIQTLLASPGSQGQTARRDRALLLFLYNTGARVQEVATLRVSALDLGDQPRVRLCGKGGKWRTCPLWQETVKLLRTLLPKTFDDPERPVFVSRRGTGLTRFGIYKIVRRHAQQVENRHAGRHITPHMLRHTTAVHLLESGTEVNVIRGWLGHASLATTNHYAEITIQTKQKALARCEPPLEPSEEYPTEAVWRNDASLLNWLDSL